MIAMVKTDTAMVKTDTEKKREIFLGEKGEKQDKGLTTLGLHWVFMAFNIDTIEEKSQRFNSIYSIV